MSKEFYVYVYYRLDTNEPFYVGKGKGDRWKHLRGRNNIHFNNIINKYPIIAIIEKDNLTEEEAFYWEEKIIETLVFDYGFSIEIKGCNSNNHYCHLVNQTWGGEGISGYSPSEKTRKKQSNTMKKIHEIKIHPMQNKHHTEEAKKKMSEKAKLRIGELNHMYGKCHSVETKKKISETRIKNNLSKGKNNSNAKSIICLTTKKIFFTVREGAKFYNAPETSIGQCCKGFKMHKGKKRKVKSAGKLFDGTPLVWKYLVWKHDKKYRISEVK